MLAPDLQFMVHTAEIVDEEGIPHRGSRVTLVDRGAEPPEWRLRDFAFAAYSCSNAPGLRPVHFGGRSIWAFASAREHCEEIVVFRSGTDTRAKWEQGEMHDVSFTSAKIRADMFFMMRMRQIGTETPLMTTFNGEWGFWESFYVPLLDEQQTMQSLLLMDPGMCEDHFEQKRLPVTCHKCPEGNSVLTIPDDLVVRFEVKIACKDMKQWTELCTKIGDDMRMEDACVIDHKHLNRGDECLEAYQETQGVHVHARLVKRDLEQLELPVIAKFKCELNVKKWNPDMISLRYKYEAMTSVYTMNLGGGLSSMSGRKADPWYPVARLAVAALTKVFARFPDIRTVLDAGCGELAWMQYFLEEHPLVTYVGVDLVPYVLATNFRRFPRMQFIQTDLSNLTGIEVMPMGCDLVLAKDVFNHMVLPDAVNALKRVLATRPRFLLTHLHESADNTGWENRIDKHLITRSTTTTEPRSRCPTPSWRSRGSATTSAGCCTR
ncbi:unnamed protein product [Prorocentrum cordatum]|uniref:Methyltransferase type 12 domain-containing protein n=1 Tax=Prorocentrum cordatum TaxID=2364126 RepID=A0ABN9VIJ1_9DINO|nr:unnamed protein product [Polarella glacialis]